MTTFKDLIMDIGQNERGLGRKYGVGLLGEI